MIDKYSGYNIIQLYKSWIISIQDIISYNYTHQKNKYFQALPKSVALFFQTASKDHGFLWKYFYPWGWRLVPSIMLLCWSWRTHRPYQFWFLSGGRPYYYLIHLEPCNCRSNSVTDWPQTCVGYQVNFETIFGLNLLFREV